VLVAMATEASTAVTRPGPVDGAACDGLEFVSVRGGEVVEATAELGRTHADIRMGLPVLYFEVRKAGRSLLK
jgi:hypothetical protein